MQTFSHCSTATRLLTEQTVVHEQRALRTHFPVTFPRELLSDAALSHAFTALRDHMQLQSLKALVLRLPSCP